MPDPLLVNANARRLLERLYTQAMQEHDTIEGVIFTVDQTDADALGITMREVEAARERLVRAGLCERTSYENFNLTNEGLDAIENAELLDHVLPVAAAVPPPSTVVAANEVNRDARDLLSILRDRAVSAAARGVVVIHAEYAEAELGFDGDRFARAAARLVERDFAVWMGMGRRQIRIADGGVEMAETEEELDRRLPLAGAKRPEVSGAVIELLDAVISASRDFVADAQLRAIVERDLEELRVTLAAGLSKASAILTGSVIEALLIDTLERNKVIPKTYMTKHKSFPADASLGDLVEIGSGEGLLEEQAVSMVNCLRDFRDLVHPDRERRLKPKVDAATSHALLALLRLVLRDLEDSTKNDRLKDYIAKGASTP